ncbi:MAG: hypothetical protein GQ531_11630 [Sulfurovum sp.]|nr:hypothetical protein [Sulfurovum sp.]
MNEFSKLKSLSSLKNQRKEEEKAFEQLKNVHPHLSHLRDSDILQFFGLKKREEIVGYKVLIQETPSSFDKNKGEGICLCNDSKGHGKFLYGTYDEAKEKNIALQQEQQIKLKVYACPTTNGWHLSKS